MTRVPAKTVNKLTSEQTFKLATWLTANQERITKDGLSSTEVTRQAAAAVGFTITTANVCAIMGNSRRAFIKHEWKDGGRRNGIAPERLERILRALAAYALHGGKHQTDEDQAVLEELVTAPSGQLFDTHA